MADEVTDEEMETGVARARLFRLISRLGKARGVGFSQALDKIVCTEAWRRAGSPDPKHVTKAQAEELCAVIERWIAKAETEPPRPRRIVSKAPPPPWAARGEDRRKGNQ